MTIKDELTAQVLSRAASLRDALARGEQGYRAFIEYSNSLTPNAAKLTPHMRRELYPILMEEYQLTSTRNLGTVLGVSNALVSNDLRRMRQKPLDPQGYAYMMVIPKLPGECRLGSAADWERRLTDHQTTRYDAEFRAVWVGGLQLEGLLHSRFKRQCIGGSWYAVTLREVEDAVSNLGTFVRVV